MKNVFQDSEIDNSYYLILNKALFVNYIKINYAYVDIIYCISMLRKLFYINWFGIFAYWYFHSWNNIIIDG